MATLPSVEDLGRRRAPQPQRGIAQVSPAAATATARAVSDLGDMASRVGFEAIDREATAAAKERDVLVSEQIRTLLYDPESGYANLSGGSAVQARGAVLQKLEALQTSAMEGLSRPAQKKLQDALLNRLENAKGTVDRHASGERRTWINGASDARIESAYQDAVIDPASTSRAVNTITSELRGKAVREGWAPEKTALEIEKATSKVYNDQIIRVASTDPIAAMQQLRAHQDKMLPVDVVNLEAKLQPAVKEAIGWQRGREIFQHVSMPAMASFKALEDAAGFPLKVNSAYRDPEHNARVGGAKQSQHTHGNAFDVDVSGMSTEQRVELIRKARAAGFSGIGVYANSLHFDVGGDRAWGPSYGRESLPAWAADAVTSPIGAQPSMWDSVLAEDDPIIRKSMTDAISLQQSILDGERKAERAAARDAAFLMIESGGALQGLTLDQKAAIGEEGMSALMTYQNKKNSGDPIETDPETYIRMRRMQSDNPAEFRNFDMTTVIDKLSESDWQGFVDAQTKPSDTVTTVAASTLMTTAKRHMEAAGIDTSPKDGTDDAKRVATIQTQLLNWQDQYIRDHKTAPPHSEIDKQTARMMATVTIDPKGLLNEKEVFAFDLGTLDIAEGKLSDAEITVGDVTYSPEQVSEATAALRDAGLPVTAENLVQLLGMAGL